MPLERGIVRTVSIRCASVLVAVLLAGCEEKKLIPTADAATTIAAPARDAAAATIPGATIPDASTRVDAVVDAGSDAAEEGRFNPKHKCPAGQTHFYMEGDFCRRKCLTTSDCAGRERCSAMQYPFVADGKTAGTSRFCEGM
jgi:hypothetical protein